MKLKALSAVMFVVWLFLYCLVRPQKTLILKKLLLMLFSLMLWI